MDFKTDKFIKSGFDGNNYLDSLKHLTRLLVVNLTLMQTVKYDDLNADTNYNRKVAKITCTK